MKLSEIVEAAGCSKASAPTSGVGSGRRMCRRGGRFGGLVGIEIEAPSHPPGTLTEEVAIHAT